MAEVNLGHSPLGGSATHRFIACPGSVGLGTGIHDEESDFAAEGTTAHAVAEACLNAGQDPWEYVGCWHDGKMFRWAGEPPNASVVVTKDMADALQVYVSAVRAAHPDRNQSNFFVERKFHCPSLHKFYWGMSDCNYIDEAAQTLHIWDLKFGVGVVVEAPRNPQLLYYAAGILEELNLWGEVGMVVVHIAQPRAFHFDGPLREWSISTANLAEWLNNTLLPAMDRALVSNETKSGEHCRFCPARSRACPQLLADMDELERIMATMQTTPAAELTNDQVARFLDLFDVAKIVNKAASDTAFQRLMAGQTVEGRKLAKARANRVFKEGAEEAAKKQFGKKAYSTPELLTPAQLEKLPEGETFVARWAFKPDAGLTVVKGDDTRAAVSRDTKSMFTDQSKKQKQKSA